MISVIVPNYNHAKFLEQRLDSILNQTYQDFEVIILDDASTDNSVEILNKYSNHEKVTHLVLNEKNSGSPFKQWKKGIDLAKGDFIWIAESDDWSNVNFLNSCIETIKNDTQIEFVFCKSKIYNNTDHTEIGIEAWMPLYKKEQFLGISRAIDLEFLEKYYHQMNYISNASAVLFRNDPQIFERYLLMAQSYKLTGDWLFWLSFVMRGKGRFINEVLNHNRLHHGTARNLNKAVEKKEVIEFLLEYYKVLERLKLPKGQFMLSFVKWCFKSEPYLNTYSINIKNVKLYLNIKNIYTPLYFLIILPWTIYRSCFR
ncbi:glycosyltransferase [Reichenbachiella sp. MALMAid0571]|uniref:glycosyltransferase family 2 protein n=1 Tax=Reichenbachiella sp. MALMAid0571 TaxID=3143939 RepID=UPI0032DFAD16